MAKRIVTVICPKIMREYLRYEPDTGKIFWRNVPNERNQWNKQRAGTEAFSFVTEAGYKRGAFKGKSLYAHRVAWVLQTGEWPEEEIDHINADRSDNRFLNLRPVTRAENSRNRKISKGSTSGLKGAHWNSSRGKWESSIKIWGEKISLGYFPTKEAAHRAYCEAAKENHGDYARFH